MKKRGISPLIATVLIISFTIILGAFVMIWGTDIFNRYIKGTSEEAGVALECSKTSLSIKETCVYGNNVYLSLENTGQTDIASFLTRISGEKGKALNETGDLLGVYSKKIFDLDFEEFDEIGIPKEIEIYPKIIYENKEYICDYANKKEVKSCFKLANEFDVEQQDYKDYAVVLSKEDIKKIGDLYPGITLQTEMETAPNILFIQSLDESRIITATSKPFTVPNGDKINITGLSLYTEIFPIGTLSISYSLISPKNEFGEIFIFPTTNPPYITTTPIPSTHYRIEGDLYNNIKGKKVQLKINFNGQGYVTVFRFCYNDDSDICII